MTLLLRTKARTESIGCNSATIVDTEKQFRAIGNLFSLEFPRRIIETHFIPNRTHSGGHQLDV